MALWRRIIDHPGFERIKSLYNDQFPLEVRFICADWIEECMKTELLIDINDRMIEKRAANFVQMLIQQVDLEREKLQRTEEMPIRFRLKTATETFRQHMYNPFVIYKQIRDAVQSEQYLLDYYNANADANCGVDNETAEINKALDDLRNVTGFLNNMYERYQQDVEQFNTFQCTEPLKQLQQLDNNNVTSAELENARLQIIEETKRRKCSMFENIQTLSQEIYQHVQYLIVEIDKVQKTIIINRLGAWQQGQAQAGNGAPLPMNTLDEVQAWFERLAESIWFTRNLISKVRTTIVKYQLMLGEVFDGAYKDITMLLQNLIVSAFIVEKQPPQVMKTHTRFTSTVRFLLTNVGVQTKNPSVSVSILSENQAQLQQKNSSKPIEESCGEILNNTGNLEIQTSGHLTCNLINMQLKKIKRAEKKSTESVMDEKFSLRFKSTFQCSDVQINVWVMSLPIVVIVHGSQEPQSWATITWDNAFGTLGRVPFTVSDRVLWSRLGEVLNTKFASQTGRGLSNENLQYLCEKALRAPLNFNSTNKFIAWTQFCKETLPDRTFTFWDWFYAIMKLTRHHLRNPWTEGRIIGFINKKQAEEMLLKCSPGTFLLRYSDSELGGITIAWVEYNENLSPHIVMLQPFSQKDFAIRSLSDRIKDLNQCVTLYPDIPKDTAFGSYYTPLGEVTSNGYVKPILKTTVPGDSRSFSSSNANTPQYNTNWQSPDYKRDTSSVGSDFNCSNDINMDNTDYLPNYVLDGLLDSDVDALMKM